MRISSALRRSCSGFCGVFRNDVVGVMVVSEVAGVVVIVRKDGGVVR